MELGLSWILYREPDQSVGFYIRGRSRCWVHQFNSGDFRRPNSIWGYMGELVPADNPSSMLCLWRQSSYVARYDEQWRWWQYNTYVPVSDMHRIHFLVVPFPACSYHESSSRANALPWIFTFNGQWWYCKASSCRWTCSRTSTASGQWRMARAAPFLGDWYKIQNIRQVLSRHRFPTRNNTPMI